MRKTLHHLSHLIRHSQQVVHDDLGIDGEACYQVVVVGTADHKHTTYSAGAHRLDTTSQQQQKQQQQQQEAQLLWYIVSYVM
jgi:hypothetical protein